MCQRLLCFVMFFFQAEDGIRDLVRSRGLGDVYKRQFQTYVHEIGHALGLDHMGNYNGNGNWTPSSFQDLSLIHI